MILKNSGVRFPVQTQQEASLYDCSFVHADIINSLEAVSLSESFQITGAGFFVGF